MTAAQLQKKPSQGQPVLITSEHIREVFDYGCRVLSNKEAVQELMRLTGARPSTAYAALGPGSRFLGLVRKDWFSKKLRLTTARQSGTPLIGDRVCRGQVFAVMGASSVVLHRALAALAIGAAEGANWFGLPVHQPLRTLILQGESGRGRWLRDFPSWQTLEAENRVRVLAGLDGIAAGGVECVDGFLRGALAAFGPDVVLIDSGAGTGTGNDRGEALRAALTRFVADAGQVSECPAVGIVGSTRGPSFDALSGLSVCSESLGSIPRAVFALRASDRDDEGAQVEWVDLSRPPAGGSPPDLWQWEDEGFRPVKPTLESGD
jgi:hypothetical protein